jgi:zinc/manganese transport system substrate-binding protein
MTMRTTLKISIVPLLAAPGGQMQVPLTSRTGSAALRALPVLSALLLLAGCGAGSGEADEEGPRVVATTGVAADIAARVAGEDAGVSQLVPDASSPHGYALSARQQQELAQSDLLVMFDPSLEQGLPIETAERRFVIADHAGPLLPFAGESGNHERDGGGHRDGNGDEDEHASGGTESRDPHVWMDPMRVRRALPALARELAGVDPAGAEGYRRRAAGLAAELERLDAELERDLAAIPPARRKLVSSHDLLGYFADRYDFEVVGAAFGPAPEAEASAARVAGLIDQVETAGVPAVFAQQGDDPKVLRQVADAAGVEVVDDLLVEGLGEQAGSYVEMLRYTGARIADALDER